MTTYEIPEHNEIDLNSPLGLLMLQKNNSSRLDTSIRIDLIHMVKKKRKTKINKYLKYW